MTKEHVPNQLLEFTIHPGFDENEISRSPSPKELPRVEDDIIAVLSEIRTDHNEEVQSGKDITHYFFQLKKTIAERESLDDNTLLQDLKAMKEEVWAKKKAMKLKRQMKKVQFLDETGTPLPFCRSCCAKKKDVHEGLIQRFEGLKSSGEKGEQVNLRIGQNEKFHFSTKKERPIFHIHSTNMFQNIIPKQFLQQNLNRSHYPNILANANKNVKRFYQ